MPHVRSGNGKRRIMNFNEYQELTDATAIYPQGRANGSLYYVTMGLASEAGEVAGKVKKALRDENGLIDDARADAIASELGDVLWYCARIATEIGYNLGDVAEANIMKLATRKSSGTLQGDGDNR